MTITSVAAFVVEPPARAHCGPAWIPGHPLQFTFSCASRTAQGALGAGVTWLPDSTRAATDAAGAELYAPMLIGCTRVHAGRHSGARSARSRISPASPGSGVLSTARCGISKPERWGCRCGALWVATETVSSATDPPRPWHRPAEALRLAGQCKEAGFAGVSSCMARGLPTPICPFSPSPGDAFGGAIGAHVRRGMNALTFDAAIRIGRLLDEQGFEWFEAPLVDDDLPRLRPGWHGLDRHQRVERRGLRCRSHRQLAQMVAAGARSTSPGWRGTWRAASRRWSGAVRTARGRASAWEPRCYGPTIVQSMHLAWILLEPRGPLLRSAAGCPGAGGPPMSSGVQIC